MYGVLQFIHHFIVQFNEVETKICLQYVQEQKFHKYAPVVNVLLSSKPKET